MSWYFVNTTPNGWMPAPEWVTEGALRYLSQTGLRMERSEQFHPSKPCVRRRAQPISPVAAAQPTHITAATAETATAYLFVNRVPSLGCRTQATRKEGGEHHGKIHPDPLHPLPPIYRNPTRFPVSDFASRRCSTSTPSWPWCCWWSAPAPTSRCSSRQSSTTAPGNFLSSAATLPNHKESGNFHLVRSVTPSCSNCFRYRGKILKCQHQREGYNRLVVVSCV